ncbi:hypothetical protein I3760_03G177600, partial [Carya illinoinensis]
SRFSIRPYLCGQSGTSPLTLDESPPLPPNEPIGNRKSVRGANFTPEEDKLLVSAWLNCNLDAVQGTDQKHAQLWENIFEYFQQFKETSHERIIKYLIHRWLVIQKATKKFCAKLAQVEGLNQSGMTDQDKFDKAKVMYQALEKCSFQLEHCWHLLKDQPKWIWQATKDDPNDRIGPTNWKESRERKTKGPRQASRGKFPTQEDEVYSFGGVTRSGERVLLNEGREDGDERLRLEAEKMRIEAEKEQNRIRQEDERLRLEAEKVELAKKESDQRIMMMDVSVMPEMQRLYFQQLQREIISRCNTSKY